MPRARSTESVEAEKLYHSGKKLVDIARELNVPDSTVRRWKSDQKWDKTNKKKQTERSDKKPNGKPNARKRGAQPRNSNAKGGPPGNIKAAKHGAYMKIYGDIITDKQKERLPYILDQSLRDRLELQYANALETEIRIMEYIKEIENGAKEITIKTNTQTEPTGKKLVDGREAVKVIKISQERIAREMHIRDLTETLIRARESMRRITTELRQLDETEAKIKAITDGEDEIASLVDAINSVWEEESNETTD